MYCKNCGKEIDKSFRVCPYCGENNVLFAENENIFDVNSNDNSNNTNENDKSNEQSFQKKTKWYKNKKIIGIICVLLVIIVAVFSSMIKTSKSNNEIWGATGLGSVQAIDYDQRTIVVEGITYDCKDADFISFKSPAKYNVSIDNCRNPMSFDELHKGSYVRVATTGKERKKKENGEKHIVAYSVEKDEYMSKSGEEYAYVTDDVLFK